MASGAVEARSWARTRLRRPSQPITASAVAEVPSEKYKVTGPAEGEGSV